MTSKYFVIVQGNLKENADPVLVEKWKRWMISEFMPAEKEAPGLISIELVERFRDPVPHQPNNRASDLAIVEFWESAEANHQWWAGDQTERLKRAFESGRDLDVIGEMLDCHYSVLD